MLTGFEKCRGFEHRTYSTSTVSQPVADHILAVWGDSHTKALVTNNNGKVVDIEWGNEGDVTGWSRCAIEHQNISAASSK